MRKDFVRYVYDGCVELGQRLQEDPNLARQMEDVIQEQTSRTPLEALDIERGLAVLTGAPIAKSVMGCLRYLETYEETVDLLQDFDEQVVRFLRYLVARYGPVLRAFRRRNNHPLGWHKFGHIVTKMENGDTHLHIKLHRNDDAVLVLEDDTESMMRLINLMLKALEKVDDYESLDEATIEEFSLHYEKLIEATTTRGVIGGNRTEH